MSLGSRRKLAIAAAFAHDPEVLILDEPTSGLDPIMQQRFVEFIIEEKQRGKSILLSSHIFREVSAACDEVSIIRQGRIVDKLDPRSLGTRKERVYEVRFATQQDLEGFLAQGYDTISSDPRTFTVTVKVDGESLPRVVHSLARRPIEDFREKPFSLEDYFMHFYEPDRQEEPGKGEIRERTGHIL